MAANQQTQPQPQEQAGRAETRFEKGARLVCLVMALVGVVVTAVPFRFQLEPYYVPLILVGSGIAVIALAAFLYYSI